MWQTAIALSLLTGLLLLPGTAVAQGCWVQGAARLSDSEQHSGISVQLLSPDAAKVLGFRTTDAQGHFALSAPEGESRLYMAQIGYQDTMLIINCRSDTLSLGPLTLAPLSFDLAEISVVDKAALLRKSGDTTIFNIQLLETGREQSVTDIIERVPGFFIDNGYIYYQNKKVGDVLVEGRQIATGKDADFTDGISYQSIQSLRLIENYFPGSVNFSPDSTSQQLALDIRLKEEYTSQWQGTLSLAAGYEAFYEAAGNALTASIKSAFSLNLDAANTRHELYSNNIEQAIRDAQHDQLFQNPFIFVQQRGAYSQSVAWGHQFNQRNSYRLHGAADVSLHDRANYRAKLELPFTAGRQSYRLERQFRSEVPAQFGEEANAFASSAAFLDQVFRASLKNGMRFELELPVTVQLQAADTEEYMTLGTTSTANAQNASADALALQPIYKFAHTFPNDIRLTVAGKYEHEQNHYKTAVSSNDSIAGITAYQPEQMAFAGTQNQGYAASRLNHQIRARKQLDKLLLEAHFAANRNRERRSNQTGNKGMRPFSGESRLRYQNALAGIRLRYDLGKWRLSANLMAARYQLSNAHETQKNSLLSPGFFALYRIGNGWNVSARYALNSELPRLEHTNALHRFRDATSFLSGMTPLGTAALRESFNLGVFKDYSIALNSLQFNLNLTYVPAMQDFQPVNSFQGLYQLSTFQLVDKQQEWLASLWCGMSAEQWTARLTLNSATSSVRLQGQLVYDRMLQLRPSFKFTGMPGWSVHADAIIRYTQRRSGQSLVENTLLNPRLSLRFEHHLFRHQLRYQLQHNRTQGAANNYHRLDYELSRKQWKERFEYFFKGIDLLNLTGATIGATEVTPAYFQTSEFDAFPGHILIGLKWYWGSQSQR